MLDVIKEAGEKGSELCKALSVDILDQLEGRDSKHTSTRLDRLEDTADEAAVGGAFGAGVGGDASVKSMLIFCMYQMSEWYRIFLLSNTLFSYAVVQILQMKSGWTTSFLYEYLCVIVLRDCIYLYQGQYI